MKAPKNLPLAGEAVQLRGRGVTGKITFLNGLWAWIEWNTPKAGPLICHLYELERLR